MMWHEKIRLQALTYMYGVCMFIIGSCAAGSLFFYLSDVYSIYAFNETPWLAWEKFNSRLYHVNLITCI